LNFRRTNKKKKKRKESTLKRYVSSKKAPANMDVNMTRTDRT